MKKKGTMTSNAIKMRLLPQQVHLSDGALQLSLERDVQEIMAREAADRGMPVEELVGQLVRLAAMKSAYNETIHSATGPIGLV